MDCPSPCNRLSVRLHNAKEEDMSYTEQMISNLMPNADLLLFCYILVEQEYILIFWIYFNISEYF